jgi:hypothetical protein
LELAGLRGGGSQHYPPREPVAGNLQASKQYTTHMPLIELVQLLTPLGIAPMSI